MARYGNDYWEIRRGFSMRPDRRPGSLDPNYHHGEYYGERMDTAYEGQAPYGRHRYWHAGDLGAHGGFNGRYDAGEGHMDDSGLFRDPFDRGAGREGGVRHPYYDRDFFRGGGGVHRNVGYLSDYNAGSPALRFGSRYDRSFGHAGGDPGRGPVGEGPYSRDGFTREANLYGGRNTGGFAEGTRPRQAGRGSFVPRKNG